MNYKSDPKDKDILCTRKGEAVYSKRGGGYTLDKSESYEGVGPVTALKIYGLPNNRSTKKFAEKDMMMELKWKPAK